MIISFWRYCHLALAVSSFVFILLATITGVILAFEPVTDMAEVGSASKVGGANLAQTVDVMKQRYLEVFSISVDENGLVHTSVMDENGDFGAFYINPLTGEKTADLIKQAPLYQFATNLHRSLFLKSTGRFFVGLGSLLLFFIAASGLMLILKRQNGIRHFFDRIVRENFFQYSHVYLGRLSLVPIMIITLTGVYLSLLRFELIPASALTHNVDYINISDEPKQAVADFALFQNIPLADVREVEFPFSEDVEDTYKLLLDDRELLVNQYTGEVLSELESPFTEIATNWSIILHTGRGSVIWALVLALACLGILYFMWSGFAMTLKRRESRIKNKYKKDQCKYVILVGSETGSTIKFAALFQQQLLAAGEKAYLAELNHYSEFKKMEHLVVFTATYGLGEPPANATKFAKQFKNIQSPHPYSFSVVGFGSLAYAHFCQFAFDVDKLLQTDPIGNRLLETYTINNRSWEAFSKWLSQWGETVNLNISVPPENPIALKRKKKHTFTVVSKTSAQASPDDTFTLLLGGVDKKIQSGDLLAVYPNDKTHERLYSIGLTEKNEVLLSVKRHEQGLCSNFLNDLNTGERVEASIVNNGGFHFPKRARQVVMVSNGTGIAPFLGMLNQNHQKAETHLYWGGRNEKSFELYEAIVSKNVSQGRLAQFSPAYSRVDDRKIYVQHLIEKDAVHIAAVLRNKGVIMVCGSIAMQKEVTAVLNKLCLAHNNKPLSHYQNKGRLLMDCY